MAMYFQSILLKLVLSIELSAIKQSSGELIKISSIQYKKGNIGRKQFTFMRVFRPWFIHQEVAASDSNLFSLNHGSKMLRYFLQRKQR